ncbi:MAG: hypothetical protein GY847_09330 [Proteobacteria bacterium]|nr:hypothetical protein [Pseudomonadota bacterium]
MWCAFKEHSQFGVLAHVFLGLLITGNVLLALVLACPKFKQEYSRRRREQVEEPEPVRPVRRRRQSPVVSIEMEQLPPAPIPRHAASLTTVDRKITVASMIDLRPNTFDSVVLENTPSTSASQ